MKMKSVFVLFFYCGLIFGQIRGIVVDGNTGEPVSYANIWIQNEQTGAMAEENGTFYFASAKSGNELQCTALGYETKFIKALDYTRIELMPAAINLREIVIRNIKGTRQLEIGETESSFMQAQEEGPVADIKFFPFYPKYKRTRYIKQVVINTDSRIDEALLRLRFYTVNDQCLPAEELLKKDLIVSVQKGVRKTTFNLMNYDLVMPEKGIFVAVERLKVDRNKYEKTVKDYSSGRVSLKTIYCPFLLYNSVEAEQGYTNQKGKWSRAFFLDEKGKKFKKTIYEPAINLILTN